MKSKADPTGQARNRRKALKPFKVRLTIAQKRTLEIVGRMQSTPRVVQINAQKTFHDWAVTPEQLADINALIALEIQSALEVIPSKPPQQWYGGEELKTPAQAGTLEAVNTVNRDLAGLVIAGFLVRGIKPQPFDSFGMTNAPTIRDSLTRNINALYGSTKALADRLTSRVTGAIARGIKSRQSPRSINRELRSSFEKARAEAKRSVDTSVNDAYTDAVMATTMTTADNLDISPRVIHISALTSTTRPHHAARHKLSYTVEEQEAWWDQGANRYNCKCSVLPDINAGN